MPLASVRLALSLVAVPIAAYAQTDVPKGAQPENPGKLSAATGATLLEAGQGADSKGLFIVHGYAAPTMRPPRPGEKPGSKGEISFFVKEVCLTGASAQVNPIWTGAAPAATAEPSSLFFVTDVDVEWLKQQEETCTFSVKITFGANVPPDGRITQVGYTVFLSGKKRTPESEPRLLKTPL